MAFYPYRPSQDPGGAMGRALSQGLGNITNMLLTKQADEEQYQRIKAARDEDRAIRAAERAEDQAWREQMHEDQQAFQTAQTERQEQIDRETRARTIIEETAGRRHVSPELASALEGTSYQHLLERRPAISLPPGQLGPIAPERTFLHPEAQERYRNEQAQLAREAIARQEERDKIMDARADEQLALTKSTAKQSQASAEATALMNAIAIYSTLWDKPPQKSEYGVETTTTPSPLLAGEGLQGVPRTTSWTWKLPGPGYLGGKEEYEAAFAAWREGFARTHPQYRDHPLLNPTGETPSIAKTPSTVPDIVEGYGDTLGAFTDFPGIPYRPDFEPTPDLTEAATTALPSPSAPEQVAVSAARLDGGVTPEPDLGISVENIDQNAYRQLWGTNWSESPLYALLTLAGRLARDEYAPWRAGQQEEDIPSGEAPSPIPAPSPTGGFASPQNIPKGEISVKDAGMGDVPTSPIGTAPHDLDITQFLESESLTEEFLKSIEDLSRPAQIAAIRRRQMLLDPGGSMRRAFRAELAEKSQSPTIDPNALLSPTEQSPVAAIRRRRAPLPFTTDSDIRAASLLLPTPPMLQQEEGMTPGFTFESEGPTRFPKSWGDTDSFVRRGRIPGTTVELVEQARQRERDAEYGIDPTGRWVNPNPLGTPPPVDLRIGPWNEEIQIRDLHLPLAEELLLQNIQEQSPLGLEAGVGVAYDPVTLRPTRAMGRADEPRSEARMAQVPLAAASSEYNRRFREGPNVEDLYPSLNMLPSVVEDMASSDPMADAIPLSRPIDLLETTGGRRLEQPPAFDFRSFLSDQAVPSLPIGPVFSPEGEALLSQPPLMRSTLPDVSQRQLEQEVQQLSSILGISPDLLAAAKVDPSARALVEVYEETFSPEKRMLLAQFLDLDRGMIGSQLLPPLLGERPDEMGVLPLGATREDILRSLR